jgi:SET domain-containing protein
MNRLQPKSLLIRHESAHFRLRIGRSRIHRYGVFALEDIPQGHEVIEYTGKKLSLDQAALLKPPHDDYLVGPFHGYRVNGSVGGSGAQFINHSCNPNLTWQRRKSRLFFHSRKAIRAGQELTMYFSHPIKARRVPCVCGARNCRKILRYLIE